ncbi:MAG: OmpA family protein [Bacteroidota bacterium]
MRHVFLLFLAFVLCGCVSNKRFEEQAAKYTAELAEANAARKMSQDSMLNLRLALERVRGGNASLLAIQERLQDRLGEKENALDELQGNLTSTSSQLRREAADSKATAAAAEAAYDTLLMDQRAIIVGYQKGVNKALSVLTASLDGKVPDETFDVADGPGQVTLSVQEDLLFRPKSVERLTDEAEIVLRAVMDALQSDPLLKLTVIGHTDNQPNPRRNTNNWEYAALRATYLADELAKTYYLSPNRVVAASHGEYGPIKSNATEEGRRANRRIDFVLRNNVGNLLRELNKLEGERP